MTRAPSAAPRGAVVTRAAATAALLAVLLGACAAGTPAPDPPTGAVTLPWPADAAGSALLQEQVDGGSQPWLLDPDAVATSFGAAAYGWTASRIEDGVEDGVEDGAGDGVESGGDAGGAGGTPQRPGRPVVLRGPDGTVADLVLVQPGRTGPHGVWVVSEAGPPRTP